MSNQKHNNQEEIKEIIDEMLTDGLVNKNAVVWESHFNDAVRKIAKLNSRLLSDYKKELIKKINKLNIYGPRGLRGWYINKKQVMNIIKKDDSIEKERKELKLKAKSIGTPDGYVKIDSLFKDVPDIDPKEFLSELSKK